MKCLIALGFGIMFAATCTVTWAHNGGLSKKDQCHNMRDKVTKEVAERHWHKLGTVEKGGICVEGRQIPAAPSYQDLEDSIQKLQQSLHESIERENAARSAVNELKRGIITANDLADTAQLREQMGERKLRAVVSGAPVCALQRRKLEGKTRVGIWRSRGWRDEAVNLLECLSMGELGK